MEYGICICYEYSGDEPKWQQAIEAFITAIQGDPNTAGAFKYTVSIGKNGTSRVHIGEWDTAETLAAVQATDYFKTFAAAVQNFAGDSLSTTPFNRFQTSG